MKKLLLMVLLLLFPLNIFALDNDNILTTEEADFGKALYDVNDVNELSEGQLKYIKKAEVNKNNLTASDVKVEIKAVDIDRDLFIRKTCVGGVCIIVLSLQWNSIPVTRSYDVMGARFSGTSIMSNDVLTTMTVDGTGNDIETQKFLSNGFGVSIKLPSTINKSLRVTQTFDVEQKGTVYGAYTHATHSVLSAASTNFTIGSSGKGGVFVFPSSIKSSYDDLDGVSISLS